MTLALGMSFEHTNCHHNLATQPPSSVLPPLSVDYVSRYPSWLVLMWSISKCFSVSLSCISLISLIFWSMSELPGAGKVQFIILHFWCLQNRVGIQDYPCLTSHMLNTSLVPRFPCFHKHTIGWTTHKTFPFCSKNSGPIWLCHDHVRKDTRLFQCTHDANTHWTHTCICYSMAMATIHKEHGSDWL